MFNLFKGLGDKLKVNIKVKRFNAWARLLTASIFMFAFIFGMQLYLGKDNEVNASTWTLRYDVNGGWGYMSDQTYTDPSSSFSINHSWYVSGSSPMNTGYAFIGWSESRTSVDYYLDNPSMKIYKPYDYFNTYSTSATLYAVWVKSPHIWKFVVPSNCYTYYSDVSKTYGSSQWIPHNTPVLTGYNFQNWTCVDSKGMNQGNWSAGSLCDIDRDCTFTANFTPIRYWVYAYDPKAYGFDMVYSTYASYDQSFWINYNPSLTGYTPLGWSTNQYATSPTYSTYQNISNLTTYDGTTVNLYYIYKPNTYTINFNPNGGVGSTGSLSMTYDESANLTSNGFSRKGYKFLGWSTDSSATSPTYTDGQSVSNLTSSNNGTVTLYAVWELNSYQIEYDLKGGTSSSETTVAVTWGEDYNLESSSVSRAGYSFEGWDTNSEGKTVVYEGGTTVNNLTSIGGKVTFYAVWKPYHYTVRFNKVSSDATGEMNDLAMTYGEEQNLNANNFERVGYTFAGWDTHESGTNVTYADSENVSNLTPENEGVFNLFAVWTPITYKVRFNKNDSAATGSMSDEEMTYDEMQNLTKNSFEKTGFSFAGWSTSPEGEAVYEDEKSLINLASTSGAIVNLYATFSENSYKVRFNKNANEATGEMADESFMYTDSKALSKNNYLRTGYIFDSWNSQADGEGTKFEDEKVVSKLLSSNGETFNLFAIWKPITYKVRFNLYSCDDSNQMTDQTLTYDKPENLKSVTYKKTFTVNYENATNSKDVLSAEFAGWASSETNAEGKVTFASDNAEVLNLGSVQDEVVNLYPVFKTPSLTLPNTSREGFVFIGWYKDEEEKVFAGKPGAEIDLTEVDTKLYASFIDLSKISISDKEYRNSEITTDDEIVIVDKSLGYTLVKGLDYDLIYSNNKEVSETEANSEKAKVTIKMKGSYEGEKELVFSIVPRKLTLSDVLLTNTEIVKFKNGTSSRDSDVTHLTVEELLPYFEINGEKVYFTFDDAFIAGSDGSYFFNPVKFEESKDAMSKCGIKMLGIKIIEDESINPNYKNFTLTIDGINSKYFEDSIYLADNTPATIVDVKIKNNEDLTKKDYYLNEGIEFVVTYSEELDIDYLKEHLDDFEIQFKVGTNSDVVTCKLKTAEVVTNEEGETVTQLIFKGALMPLDKNVIFNGLHDFELVINNSSDFTDLAGNRISDRNINSHCDFGTLTVDTTGFRINLESDLDLKNNLLTFKLILPTYDVVSPVSGDFRDGITLKVKDNKTGDVNLISKTSSFVTMSEKIPNEEYEVVIDLALMELISEGDTAGKTITLDIAEKTFSDTFSNKNKASSLDVLVKSDIDLDFEAFYQDTKLFFNRDDSKLYLDELYLMPLLPFEEDIITFVPRKLIEGTLVSLLVKEKEEDETFKEAKNKYEWVLKRGLNVINEIKNYFPHTSLSILPWRNINIEAKNIALKCKVIIVPEGEGGTVDSPLLIPITRDEEELVITLEEGKIAQIKKDGKLIETVYESKTVTLKELLTARSDVNITVNFTNRPSSRKKKEKKDEPLISNPEVIFSPYIDGYPDGTFRPNANITRAEFSKIAFNLANQTDNLESDLENVLTEEDEETLKKYQDLNSSDWYAASVSFAIINELMVGYPDGTFRPNENITRAEASKVITLIFDIKDEEDTTEYVSEIENRWYEPYVQKLINGKLINGFKDGTFKANNKMTRAEMVTLINRIIEKNFDKEENEEQKENRFSDVHSWNWFYEDVISCTKIK